MIGNTPQKSKTQDWCIVIEANKQHVVCTTSGAFLSNFQKALMVAHRRAEAAMSLSSLMGMSEGQKTKGTIFVDGALTADGDI